jgi:hypothetical protein
MRLSRNKAVVFSTPSRLTDSLVVQARRVATLTSSPSSKGLAE